MLRGGSEPSAERLDAAIKAFDRDYPKGLDALHDAECSFVRSPREHRGWKSGRSCRPPGRV